MKKTVVLYDDDCAFCIVQVRRLERLDWFHALLALPISAPEALAAAPGLTREGLARELHCVTPRGRVLTAARAFRHLFARVPLLTPLALLMWVPGAILVAEAVYRWVAAHRSWLSRVLGYSRP
ncbi:MAG: thiol-disulfide oxidoreductase DCC family protein [Chthoniobacteraceae bacterium]